MPVASVKPAIDSGKVKQLVEEQFASYVKDLEMITNIDSGTGNIEGSAQIAGILKEKYEAMGAAVDLRPNKKGTHVIVRFKGEGTFKLLMMAHIDTVFEKGEAAKRPFRLDDNKLAYGPGVGDDKATVIQTIYAMKVLKDMDYKKFGEITLYYNAEEEAGSAFADDIIIELAKLSDMCIVMDTACPDWGIVTQRKGIANYQINIQGIQGHAGNAPHRSASAVMELGNQLNLLYQLASPLPADPESMAERTLKMKGISDHGQLIPENTINAGRIGTENTKVNVIPDNAFAELEFRFFKMAEYERVDKEIKAMANKTRVSGTTVTISGSLSSRPVEKTPQVQKLIDAYKAMAKREYNAEVVEWVAGGVTDGNLAAQYVPTIDALGVENYDEHTPNEYVDLKTVIPRTVVLVNYIQELVDKWPFN